MTDSRPFFDPSDLVRRARGALQPRYEIGDIQIVNTLSGVFCEARDRVEDRQLTLKILPDLITSDVSCMDTLRRETNRSLLLSHANLWRVFSLEVEGGIPFMRLGLLPGRTVQQLVGTVPTMARVSTHLREALRALLYAHDKKVLHGDLRPSALAINETDALTLIDVAVSRTVTATLSRITGETPRGAHLYSAPEFVKRGKYGPTSEFYALACVFYELLTGNPPFLPSGDLAYQHINVAPEPLGDVLRREYGPVCDFIEAGLIKNPDERLHAVMPLVDAAVAEKFSGVTPARNRRRVSPEPKRPLVIVGRVAIVVGIAFGLGAGVMQVEGCRQRTKLFSALRLSAFSRIVADGYWRGDKEGGPDSDNPHSYVVMKKEFEIARDEVTLAQFELFLKATRSSIPPGVAASGIVVGTDGRAHVEDGIDAMLPVVGVRWSDAVGFCAWVSELDPLYVYRLPTEAEWEYAARGKLVDKRYPWGDHADASRMNCAGSGRWKVGRHEQNVNGSDFSGNAAEWVSDYYDPNYYRSTAADPLGPSDGTEHVVRGGSYEGPAEACGVAIRGRESAYPGRVVGFRLVRTLRDTEP